ncbi:MAG: putative molybdopterin synthase sulfurylase MoeB [Actinomycetota bacterium]
MASFRDLLAAAKSRITEIDTSAAADTLSAGGVSLLDVREPDEYDQGAIPGAVHIPRGHLEAQVEAKLSDKSQPVVVYCAGGYRSSIAASLLREAGFADVSDVLGGYAAIAA